MIAGKRILACLLPLVAGCVVWPAAEGPDNEAASLAAAESAFAAQSAREGMRAAFLHWLGPGSTLFRGGPVDGAATIAANPDPPIVLDWRPVHVETSASGDFGLSTGPWRTRPRGGAPAPERFGQFVSVWRKDAAGEWRVHVDLGIGHPEPSLWDAPLGLHPARRPDQPPARTLEEAEEAFARLSSAASARAAYAAHASGSIRGYRDAHAPLLGRDAFLGSGSIPAGALEWESLRAETSHSGDLGFTLGRYRTPGSATAGHYLRVWRREGAEWRIALDITEPLPRS